MRRRKPTPAAVTYPDEPADVVAHHEAGHVVFAARAGFKIHSVSIVGNGPEAGRVTTYGGGNARSLERATAWIRMLLAGPCAETKYRGSVNQWTLQNDMHMAHQAAQKVAGHGLDNEDTRELYIEWVFSAVVKEIIQPATWHLVEAIAGELLARQTLTGADLVELLARA